MLTLFAVSSCSIDFLRVTALLALDYSDQTHEKLSSSCSAMNSASPWTSVTFPSASPSMGLVCPERGLRWLGRERGRMTSKQAHDSLLTKFKY